MLYCPTGRNSRLYTPASFDDVGYVKLVPVLVAITFTFGATAPLGSVTVPVMDAVTVCAYAPFAKRHNTIARTTHMLFDMEPLHQFGNRDTVPYSKPAPSREATEPRPVSKAG